MTLSHPTDRYEQEADREAERISGFRPAGIGRRSGGAGGIQPLPEPLRSHFGRQLGHDLSRVRIHTGPAASRKAAALGAQAFTLGDDVVFAAGAYRPATPTGRRLLAHELVHVAQQADGTAPRGRVQRFTRAQEQTRSQLAEEWGQERIDTGIHSGRSRLYSHGPIDFHLPPAVLVHGMGDPASAMLDVARSLQSRGMQVYYVEYDSGLQLPFNSQFLAVILSALRRRYRGTPELVLVGHSMGGLVARAAINELESPGVTGEPTRRARNPRAGFGSIRLITVDSPWAGGPTTSGSMERAPAPHPFRIPNSWRDMIADSYFFRTLFLEPPPGVEIQNISARNRDRHRSLYDADADFRLRLVRFIYQPTRRERHALVRSWVAGQGGEPQQRNLALSLEQDRRFPAFREDVVRAVDSGRLSLTDPARTEALIEIFERHMAHYVGSHIAIWDRGDPAHRALIEQIGGLVRPRRRSRP